MAWCPTPAVLDTMSVRPADPTPAACGSWPLRRSAGCPTVGTPPIDLGCWLTSSTCCATLKMSPDRRSRRASQRPFLVADSGRRSSGVKVGSPSLRCGDSTLTPSSLTTKTGKERGMVTIALSDHSVCNRKDAQHAGSSPSRPAHPRSAAPAPAAASRPSYSQNRVLLTRLPATSRLRCRSTPTARTEREWARKRPPRNTA